MPFANKKPDASINFYDAEYPPFIAECAFTESYEAVLADAVAWLTQTSGGVRAVLLVKITEIKTDTIPPPCSADEDDEDDNSPPGTGQDDPAYEHLRESTVSSEWVGQLEGFAELWRCNSEGVAERDGDRIIILPRPSTGLEKIKLSMADVKGLLATPADERTSWQMDLEMYVDILKVAVEKTAFQRRVRYLKAQQAKEGENVDGEA